MPAREPAKAANARHDAASRLHPSPLVFRSLLNLITLLLTYTQRSSSLCAIGTRTLLSIMESMPGAPAPAGGSLGRLFSTVHALLYISFTVV